MPDHKFPPYEAIPLPPQPLRSDAEILANSADYLAKMSGRHTVRGFSPRRVPQAVIEQCIAT